MGNKIYQFIKSIPENAGQIHAFLNGIVEQLKKLVPIADTVENKLRFILIELCTNYIKHVPVKNGRFMIEVDEEKIVVKKVQNQYFKGKLLAQLGDRLDENAIVEIFFSKSNNHFIKVLGATQFLFLDPLKLDLPTDSLKDHFGLHIITLGADEFIYEFDDETQTENFIAKLEL